MQLHTLQRKTAHKGPKRVGRGGLRGKTAGRGTKGQKARAGHRIRPDVREQLKKLPKLRGRGVGGLYTIQSKPAILNLSILESMFSAGDTITPATLRERGAIKTRKGAPSRVKILGTGDVTKKFIITGCSYSASAKTKIEKAGGTIS